MIFEQDESNVLVGKAVLIFWDFDGVIKDSVEVKTQAFFQLFMNFGEIVTEKVCKHHEAHGGMSRFDKLPIYLEWAGLEPNLSTVSDYCEQFSQRVLQGVIDAPWVPGVESYLRNKSNKQTFLLVSATPQDELEHILRALDLRTCFAEVYGAPILKQDAIGKALHERGIEARDCLMIGDAQADLDASEANQVPFLLRKHGSNTNVFASYTGTSVKDFTAF
jgi:phosphoglycolate phosphatase-like HAD superfamily hydrolase